MAFVLSSSSFIKTKTNRLSSFNFLYNASREGISAWQGGHQDAQKLMNTTLPLRSAVEVVLPVASVNEKLVSAVEISFTPSFFISGLNKPIETNCCSIQDFVPGLKTKRSKKPASKMVSAFFLRAVKIVFDVIIDSD